MIDVSDSAGCVKHSQQETAGMISCMPAMTGITEYSPLNDKGKKEVESAEL